MYRLGDLLSLGKVIYIYNNIIMHISHNALPQGPARRSTILFCVTLYNTLVMQCKSVITGHPVPNVRAPGHLQVRRPPPSFSMASPLIPTHLSSRKQASSAASTTPSRLSPLFTAIPPPFLPASLRRPLPPFNATPPQIQLAPTSSSNSMARPLTSRGSGIKSP